jgi:hypothetical protein
MIPFRHVPTRTLAPATGWASVNPWASFHRTDAGAQPETTENPRAMAPNADQGDCCSASWAY